MMISLGVLGAVLLFGSGLVLGLFLGERGRRRDVMWWAALDPAPKDLGAKAEIVPPPDPEGEALERAEILQVEAGLRRELEREGRTVDANEIHEEALRLVTAANASLGE